MDDKSHYSAQVYEVDFEGLPKHYTRNEIVKQLCERIWKDYVEPIPGK